MVFLPTIVSFIDTTRQVRWRSVRLQGGVNAACRVCVALAQGVGSMSQVLEGLMADLERQPAGGATGVALGACCTIAENRAARALLRTVPV